MECISILINPSTLHNWSDIRTDILSIEKVSFKEEISFDEKDFEQFCNQQYNFIALDNHKVIGYVMCEPLNITEEAIIDYEGLVEEKALHLISVAVNPEYRSKGVADALIKSVQQASILHNFDVVMLDATNDGMIKCSERRGFIKVKYFDHWDINTSWLMVWRRI